MSNILNSEGNIHATMATDGSIAANLAIGSVGSGLSEEEAANVAKIPELEESINELQSTCATQEYVDDAVSKIDGSIEDGSITPEKLSFSESNLTYLDSSILHASDFDTVGKLSSKGDIYTGNTNFVTTSNFISASPGTYIESNSKQGARGLSQVCFYSTASVDGFISTIQNDYSTGIFTAPEGTKYVRFSIGITNLESFPDLRVQKGNVVLPTVVIERPYKLNAITTNEIYYNDIIVNQDGTGDFTSVQQAVAVINDSSFNNRYNIFIHEGDYDVYSDLSPDQLERGIILPDYTYLIGVGRKENVILRGQHEVGEDDRNVSARSPLNINKNNGLKNLTVIAKNSRYAVHADNGNKYKNYTWEIENCDFIHEGNDSSFSWKAIIAWGSGSASGAREYFKNCTFKGNAGYTTHNNVNFDADTYQEFENCKFIGAVRLASVQIISLGSTVKNKVVFKGCQFTGFISCDLNGAEDVDFDITGFNNSKVAHSMPSTTTKFINFSDEINTAVIVSKPTTKGVPVRDYGYQVEPQWSTGTKDTFYGGIAMNAGEIGDVCYIKHSGFIDLTGILTAANGNYIGVTGGKLAVVENKSDAIGQVIQGTNFMKLF